MSWRCPPMHSPARVAASIPGKTSSAGLKYVKEECGASAIPRDGRRIGSDVSSPGRPVLGKKGRRFVVDTQGGVHGRRGTTDRSKTQVRRRDGLSACRRLQAIQLTQPTKRHAWYS